MAPVKILIVDDNEDAAELFLLALSHFGYAVEIAHDGQSALRLAAEFRPDIALLDIGLPGMDGYQLARQLQELAVCSDLQLIAATGYGQDEDRQRTREAGFAEHLVKPIHNDDLHRVIKRLAEK